jgi:hypothetical protein
MVVIEYFGVTSLVAALTLDVGRMTGLGGTILTHGR